MRTLVLFLCLFSVIACPYECAIRQVSSVCTQNEAIDECSEGCCAKHGGRSSEGESPTPRLPEEDGLNCFCDGVVFCNGCEADVDLDAQVVFLPWTNSALTPELAGCVGVNESFAPPLATLDSKSMRIALRSLQL
jgi:hypothetical protein